MIRFMIIATCLSAMLVGCTITRTEADAWKHGAGDVGALFGLPRPLVEGVAGLAIAAVAHVNGHQRGKRKGERQAAPRPQPGAASPLRPLVTTGTA